MGKGPRERFLRERERIDAIDDDEVRAALDAFADAVDPDVAYDDVPIVENGRIVRHESRTNGGAKSYCSCVRSAYQRGLPVLDADASTVDDFMEDMVTKPGDRRHGLVDYDGNLQRSTAKNWQGALRTFYRWATEPGRADERPSVGIEWPADDIRMFSADSPSTHDGDDLPGGDDLDALREACMASQNTRRDRAFVELTSGTGQRVYALVTLLVGDMRLEEDPPHVMLNPEIDGDGDKGAIETAGRWRPLVTNPAPIREWLSNHPLRDPERRREVGAPSNFEDCYAFVGSPTAAKTDLSSHWGINAAREMLGRRADYTRRNDHMHSVDVPVNPHNWRHFAYTRSQDIPELDEPTRRKVFGWVPGSKTGEDLYGHETGRRAGERFAELWQSHYGEADSTTVAEEVVGDGSMADLPPEARKKIATEIASDPEALQALADAAKDALD